MAKKKAKKKSSTHSGLSFEDSLEQLESVVRELEQGQLSLDSSLAKYEDGLKLLRHCYASLKDAETRVRLAVNVDETGNAKLTEFEHASDNPVDEDAPDDGQLF